MGVFEWAVIAGAVIWIGGFALALGLCYAAKEGDRKLVEWHAALHEGGNDG